MRSSAGRYNKKQIEIEYLQTYREIPASKIQRILCRTHEHLWDIDRPEGLINILTQIGGDTLSTMLVGRNSRKYIRKIEKCRIGKKVITSGNVYVKVPDIPDEVRYFGHLHSLTDVAASLSWSFLDGETRAMYAGEIYRARDEMQTIVNLFSKSLGGIIRADSML